MDPATSLQANGNENKRMTKERMNEVMFEAAAKRFDIPVEQTRREIIDHRGDYPMNVWKSMERATGMEKRMWIE